MDDGSFRGSIEALNGVEGVVTARVLIQVTASPGLEIVDDDRSYRAVSTRAWPVSTRKGISDFDMKPRIAERLSRFKDWPGFEEELGSTSRWPISKSRPAPSDPPPEVHGAVPLPRGLTAREEGTGPCACTTRPTLRPTRSLRNSARTNATETVFPRTNLRPVPQLGST